MQNQRSEDRIRNLETLTNLSAILAQEMAESQRRMSARQRRMSARQQRMETNQRQLAETIQRMEEDLQYFDGEYQLMEESGRLRDELLQQLLQAVAVMQADIVRIDETHS